ncbi:MAG: SpoIID/LytB domain-containing protein [Candidatus Nanopelagicales bacterium]
MRKVVSAVVAALIVPAGLAVPVLGGSAAPQDPVTPTVREIALAGVDGAALADSPGPGDPVLEPGGDPQDYAALVAGAGRGAAASVRTADPATDLEPAVVTPPTATDEFGLVAVVADEPMDPDSRVLVRVREDGDWGAWTELAVTEHAPDASSEEAQQARSGTEPLLTDEADGVQVRIDTPDGEVPDGTAVSLIDNPTTDADASLVADLPMSSAQAAVARPTIISRAQWGADESLRRSPPRYTSTIKVGFVHHTASTSNYSRADAARQVRNLYAYFVNSLRYSDIAYNFLVDRFGRLYEGRAGGMDRPVLGGHTAGFNQNSFAVSGLGNFETFNPSTTDGRAMYTSIARLMAWKLSMYNRDPLGTTTLVSDSGAGTSKYPPGAVATTQVIAGHGDIGNTACPGKYLHQYLPQIRNMARGLLGPAIFDPRLSTSSLTWGSGGKASITATASAAMTWQMTVYSVCATDPVRTATGTLAQKGTLKVGWDLRATGGDAVPPGVYRIDLTGTTAQGREVYPATAYVRIAATASSPEDPCGIPAKFDLVGAGWGHGVGLSQYGALGQAREGRTGEQIVSHYYPNTSVTAVPDDAEIRVGLLHQVSTAQVRAEALDAAGGGIEVEVAGSTVIGSGSDVLTFTPVDGLVKVVRSDGTSKTALGKSETVAVRWSGTRVPGSTGVGATVLNVVGPGESFSSSGHRYRYGWLEVGAVKSGSSWRLAVVNSVRIHDEYLYGIAEVPTSWPKEALRAQVIASRTYALSKVAGPTKSACRCHVDDGGGPYYDQTFSGYASETRPLGANWTAAVQSTWTGDTAGTAVMYAGKPITAFYGSSSGGRTEASEDVWGGALPYAISVDDHWSNIDDNPYASWTRSFSNAKLAAAFGLPDVATLAVTERNSSGSVGTLTATAASGASASLSGTKMRSALGLPSTTVKSIGTSGGTIPASSWPEIPTAPAPTPVEPEPTPTPTPTPTTPVEVAMSVWSPTTGSAISSGGRFHVRGTVEGLKKDAKVVLTLDGRAKKAGKVEAKGAVNLLNVPAQAGEYRLRTGQPGAYVYSDPFRLDIKKFALVGFSENGSRDTFRVATGNWSKGTTVYLTRNGVAAMKVRVTKSGAPLTFTLAARSGSYQVRVNSRQGYVYGEVGGVVKVR